MWCVMVVLFVYGKLNLMIVVCVWCGSLLVLICGKNLLMMICLIFCCVSLVECVLLMSLLFVLSSVMVVDVGVLLLSSCFFVVW